LEEILTIFLQQDYIDCCWVSWTYHILPLRERE